MLYAWHAETRADGCTDRTVYGTSRTATTSFFTRHLHLNMFSLAAVIGAALPPPRRHLGEIQEISPP
jgi:hypothetical protein